MTDEAGDDKKILAVPISQLTAFYDTVHELMIYPPHSYIKLNTFSRIIKI